MQRLTLFLALTVAGCLASVAQLLSPETLPERGGALAPRACAVLVNPTVEVPMVSGREGAAPLPSGDYTGREGAAPLPSGDYTGREGAAPLPFPNMVYGDKRQMLGMVYNEQWSGMSFPPYGIYSVKMGVDPEFQLVASNPYYLYPNGGGVAIAKKYYMTDYRSGFVFNRIFDMETWTMETNLTNGKITTVATDMSYSKQRKYTYGCFYNSDGTGFEFGRLTVNTLMWTRSKLATLDEAWNGCAFTSDGVLWALGMSGTLYKVTLSSASKMEAMTTIGQTGLAPKYRSCAFTDPFTDDLYWIVCDENAISTLYLIDKETAAATKVYQYPGSVELCGGFIPEPEAEQDAPDNVRNVSLTFEGPSLTGVLKFDAPTTLYSGAAATGTLTYKLMAGTTTLASGTTEFGAEGITDTITVASAKSYDFVLTVSNDVGESPQWTKTSWIGPDTPLAVEEMTLTYDEPLMHLKWKPVSTVGKNGGYVNPDETTYKITRYPDKTVIATAATGTELTDTVKMPADYTTYYYYIVPTYSGKTGANCISEYLNLGVAHPPFTEKFSTYIFLHGFTIIDANEDGRTWTFSTAYNSNGAARTLFNGIQPMNDWIISPPLLLEKEKYYRVKLDILNNDSTQFNSFSVAWGREATVAGMANTLIAPTRVCGTEYVTYETGLTPTEDGLYHVGVQDCSDPVQVYLYLDNFMVLAPEPGTIPAAPEVTSAYYVPAVGGVELKFTAPTKDVFGRDLTALTKIDVWRNDTLITTLDAPALGAALVYTDTQAPAGVNRYKLAAYNADGMGALASLQANSVLEAPDRPASATVTEMEDTPGTVTVSWEAPATDAAGCPIDPSTVRYNLMYQGGAALDTLLRETTVTSVNVKVCEPTVKGFAMFFIEAVNDAGKSALMTNTDALAVGAASTMPFAESVAGGSLSHGWGMARPTTSEAQWYSVRDGVFSDVSSQDGDGGFLLMQGQKVTHKCSMYSEKIAVDGVSPVLSLWYWTIAANNTNTLEVAVSTGGAYVPVDTITMGDEGDARWKEYTLDLKPYVGRQVSLRLTGVINIYTNIMVDNIAVTDTFDVADLPRVTDLSGYSDSQFAVHLTWSAPADASGSPYTLVGYNVYRDGAKVTAEPLLSTEYSEPATDEDAHTWHVTALYSEGESLPSNTVSLTVGIDGIVTDGDGFRIEAADGTVRLVSDTPCALALYDTAGRTLGTRANATTLTVRGLTPGIYLARLGTRAYRLYVR